jgi:DcaP outer membrane protein
MKRKGLRLSVAILLIGALAPLRAQAQSPESSDETQELRKLVEEMRIQMSKMQEEIDQLKGTKPAPTQAATPSTAPSTAQEGTIEAAQPPRASGASERVGEATAEYQEFNEDTVAAARFDNVPLDPKYHGYFKLPGTQTILQIGGFFKTDFIYDLKPAGNAYLFIPSSFPTPQVPGVYNANVSIRTTRLSLDFRIPNSALGDVRLYLEGDLFGTNATTPRLRHAYAQAHNLLIGQTWTNFMDPDAIADTLDLRGPNGMVLLLNPQIRYGFALSAHTTLHLSVEKPSSDVFFQTIQFALQPNSPSPDGTIRLRQEFERGHFQIAGLFRSISAYLPDGRPSSTFGWGVNTSFGVKTIGRDNLILGVAAGHGISRYIQDASGLGIDAEPASAAHPHLEATPAVGIEADYQHYWLKTLRSNAVYSYAAVDNTELAAATTYNHATFTGTNLIWNPHGSLNVGAEFLYGWKVLQNGQTANAPRFQVSAKYGFVKLNQNQK